MLKVSSKEPPSWRTQLVGKQPGSFSYVVTNRWRSKVNVNTFSMWEKGNFQSIGRLVGYAEVCNYIHDFIVVIFIIILVVVVFIIIIVIIIILSSSDLFFYSRQ